MILDTYSPHSKMRECQGCWYRLPDGIYFLIFTISFFFMEIDAYFMQVFLYFYKLVSQ